METADFDASFWGFGTSGTWEHPHLADLEFIGFFVEVLPRTSDHLPNIGHQKVSWAITVLQSCTGQVEK